MADTSFPLQSLAPIKSCLPNLMHLWLQVNHGILADGFLLPSIPHVKVERANVTVVDHALAIGADFSYVK